EVLPPGAINEGPPVTPRPSATVLVIRGRDPWELLLVHRAGGSDSAAGAYVFPGGTVHAGDMGWGDEIRMAAVREVFEEVGILLARRGRRFARHAEAAAGRPAPPALPARPRPMRCAPSWKLAGASAKPFASCAWSRRSTASSCSR